MGTVICYNRAYNDGGAIYSIGETNLASNNRAEIYGNRAFIGGGVFAAKSLDVNGALIHDNTAQVYGGGIYVRQGGSLKGGTSSVINKEDGNVYYCAHNISDASG